MSTIIAPQRGQDCSGSAAIAPFHRPAVPGSRRTDQLLDTISSSSLRFRRLASAEGLLMSTARPAELALQFTKNDRRAIAAEFLGTLFFVMLSCASVAAAIAF